MKPVTASRSPVKAQEVLPVLLYVEDETINVQAARLRLKKGYELLHASTDQEACKILRERGSDLFAILMDIQLQGSALNGMQLAQLIRGQKPTTPLPAYAAELPSLTHVPLLFVTAYGSRFASDELVKAEADCVIAKPVDFVELSLALTRMSLKRIRTMTGEPG